MKWFVVGAALLIAACDRTPSQNRSQEVHAEAVKIEDVHISAKDTEIVIQYRTQTSSRDCKAQAGELPKAWDLVVRSRLKHSRVQRVVLFPEDASLQSVTYIFAKNASGQWAAVAPCSFGIPAR
jgi:hypothetical protein